MATKRTRSGIQREPAVDASSQTGGTPAATAIRKRTSPAARDRMAVPAAEDVRVRAYYLSLERNGGGSDPLADWLRAEHDLAEGASKKPRRRVVRPK